jgi:hypothetical protein
MLIYYKNRKSFTVGFEEQLNRKENLTSIDFTHQVLFDDDDGMPTLQPKPRNIDWGFIGPEDLEGFWIIFIDKHSLDRICTFSSKPMYGPVTKEEIKEYYENQNPPVFFEWI